MQIEPYSLKKAYAMEILNEINLAEYQTESIESLYSLSRYVVIITAKRIICVEEELRSRSSQPKRSFLKQSTDFENFKIFDQRVDPSSTEARNENRSEVVKS